MVAAVQLPYNFFGNILAVAQHTEWQELHSAYEIELIVSPW